MKEKRIVKGILIVIGFIAFLFYLQGNFALAGIGFIAAGLWVAIFQLSGADVIILGGILFITHDNRLLFAITFSLLFIVAIYDTIQFYQITKDSSKYKDKHEPVELFRQKQLINRFLNKLGGQK